MIDPKIKFKEKKNFFNVKIKLTKEDTENYLYSPEGVAELKKDFLNILAAEFDSFVIRKVESEDGEELATQVTDLLEKVTITECHLCQELNKKTEEVEVN